MDYLWDVSNKMTYNNRTGKYKFRKEYSFIINNVKGNKLNILDICGGSGRFALPLAANNNNKVSVVDINNEAIDILKQHNNKITTYCVDFNEFETKLKYDLIIMIEAIGYFQNKDLVIKKTNDLLNPNGLFIFQITNPKSWRYTLRKLKKIIKRRTDYYEPSIEEVISKLQNNFFEIIEIDGFNWLPLSLSSNSIFVRFFEIIESLFKLNRILNQSPWLMICAKKVKSNL